MEAIRFCKEMASGFSQNVSLSGAPQAVRDDCELRAAGGLTDLSYFAPGILSSGGNKKMHSRCKGDPLCPAGHGGKLV